MLIKYIINYNLGSVNNKYAVSYAYKGCIYSAKITVWTLILRNIIAIQFYFKYMSFLIVYENVIYFGLARLNF